MNLFVELWWKMAKSKGFIYSFQRWIVEFRKEKSDKGILARLVWDDYSFPKSNSVDCIKTYLKRKGASNDVLNIVDAVWSEFENFPDANIQKIQTSKMVANFG